MNKQEKNTEKSNTAITEEKILSFWDENNIFEKTLEKESPQGDFVFYDGPPFATGLPHYGHLLAGTIKDIIPRYKTMQGYHVPRKWGWDCHGLPIENLIEKELGLATKKDIEDYGIEKFNTAARNSVLRYENEWKKYVPRSGRFVDMENAYMAMDSNYMESIWWVFSELHKKSLTKEDFKAMHLCPRCETTLSNFEVNQGYKDVTDISVTAKFELIDEPGTFVLAWTTTPWTLPGNVALAVGADIDYVKAIIPEDFNSDEFNLDDFKIDSGKYIYSKEAALKDTSKDSLLHKLSWLAGMGHIKSEEMKGSDLEGKKYKALFDYYQNDSDIENTENGWQIYAADFVTTEDGTGIVHIAPAFGSDDMQLGKDNALPFIQHISKSGAFKHVFAETIDGGDFAGMLVKQKGDLMSTDIEIIKRLAHDGKLFAKKKLIHSYPHCWRCDTPLLNYATTSWYVNVPKIKDQLVASNKKVHWVPEHVGEGRFGKWLEGARDWALSRSRFWGTPIPVWKTDDDEPEMFVASSVADLINHVQTSGNTYFGLRHGEAVSNTTGVINANHGVHNPLTEKGIDQAHKEAEELPNDIDYIFVSPLQRTQETAEIIKKQLHLSDDQIITDERLGERRPGKEWEGKKWHDAHAAEEAEDPKGFWNYKLADDAESISDVHVRIVEFLFEIEEKYKNKKIVIISHGGVLKTIQFSLKHYGDKKKSLKFFYETELPKNAEILNFDFKPFPHDNDFSLDLHRPYIDEVTIMSDSGKEMKRTKDVFDVWFDSASMPYAQQHYPFENKESFEKAFPAQFIAEGLDQTRGWFYVMTVIGNALFGKTPFENVVVNGLILAEDGKKMSKSLKNYPDPYDMFDSVGADAIRLYMINSPVVRGEEFAFSEKGVQEVASKVMGRLRNITTMYTMYAGDVEHTENEISDNILDQWILARLSELHTGVTDHLDSYELDRAARYIFDFIDDFSTWYVRRSRDRYKGDDIEDKKKALGTTRKVLLETMKIIAPFVPFVAEEIWQELKTDDMEESVHLAQWSELGINDKENKVILSRMELIRNIISKLLKLRSDLGIKVRQPLASVKFWYEENLPNDYLKLVKDELNVKKIIRYENENEHEPIFDTDIDKDNLRAEGNMRELLRQIQSLRKKSGLEAHDKINLIIQTSPEGQVLIEQEEFSEIIKSTAGINEFNFAHNDGEEIKVEELTFIIAIEK